MFGGWEAGYFEKQSDPSELTMHTRQKSRLWRRVEEIERICSFPKYKQVQIFGNTPAPLEREGVSPTNRIAPNKSGAAIKNLSVN